MRKKEKKPMLIGLSPIFPCNDIEETTDFYVNKLGFKAAKYLNVSEPHVCLYRDSIEIVLIKALFGGYKPNHVLYGYGFDAYFYTETQEKLEQEFNENRVNFVYHKQCASVSLTGLSLSHRYVLIVLYLIP